MSTRKEKSTRLIDVFQKMVVKMQEIDSTCVSLSKDITKKELSLIGFIGDQEEAVIMRDVADYLEVPMSTATGIVDKLVQKGHLERSHSGHDRRTVSLGLTEFGRQVYNLLSELRLNMAEMIMKELGEDEIDTFIHLLEKITVMLKQYEPSHVTSA